DFNGDGYADLAIGVLESFGTKENAGGVHVIYGSAKGLTSTGNQFWTADSPGILGGANADGDFGVLALVAADFGKDTSAGCYDDLAITQFFFDSALHETVGEVHVIYGSTTGLTATGNQLWSGSGLPQFEDQLFGRSLSSGNFRGLTSVCG